MRLTAKITVSPEELTEILKEKVELLHPGYKVTHVRFTARIQYDADYAVHALKSVEIEMDKV